MSKQIVREHPAMLLGKPRDDLERIYVLNSKGKKNPFKVKSGEQEDIVIETLVTYPNDIEIEII